MEVGGGLVLGLNIYYGKVYRCNKVKLKDKLEVLFNRLEIDVGKDV